MKKKILKKISPVTPSQRGLKLLDRATLSKQRKPIKNKSFGLKSSSGRNNKGFITIFHRGGGHKKLYRKIDFKRLTTSGVVTALEYDPFRTCHIARVFNNKKQSFSYIIAPKNLCIGSVVKSGKLAEIKLGHALPLQNIPVGSLIHNISVLPGNSGKISRAAGTYSQLIQKVKGFARLRISSGEQRLVPLRSYASLGSVSNENHKLISLGKAGRSRWLGKRPHVRGVAMNPVDHPHGGGEGKTSGGRPSVTPWGNPTKGPKTSRSKNPFVLVSRRKK